jgi:hypothetical protein
MSDLETAGRTPKPPEPSPRYMRRRAGDDKVVSEHRRGFAPTAPTGTATFQYGRRATDDKSAAAIAAAQARAVTPPSPLLSKGRELPPRVDEATPDLRRRIVEAGGATPKRVRGYAVSPLVIGLLVLLSLAVAAIVLLR